MSNYILDLRKLVGKRPLLQVGASVIVVNGKGQILLQKRADNSMWGYHGGSVELDEKTEDAAKCELLEETGLIAEELELFGVFSREEYHYTYPNGDEVSNIDIVYICKKFSGTLTKQDDEVTELKFFSVDEIPENIFPPNKPILTEYINKDRRKNENNISVTIKPVEQKDRDVLFNLLEKYLYEFSQYDGGKFGNLGVFGYPYIDNYFEEKERFAYFITVDDRLAGFVLLNNHPEADKPIDYSVAEFFVASNFRRQGVATKAMEMIFQQHKGYYHIKYHSKNLPSVCFWNKLADRYSNGTYETLTGTDTFHDGTPATVLWFKVE